MGRMLVIYRRAIQCVLLFLAVGLTGLALACGPVAQPAPEEGLAVAGPAPQQEDATPEPTAASDTEPSPEPTESAEDQPTPEPTLQHGLEVLCAALVEPSLATPWDPDSGTPRPPPPPANEIADVYENMISHRKEVLQWQCAERAAAGKAQRTGAAEGSSDSADGGPSGRRLKVEILLTPTHAEAVAAWINDNGGETTKVVDAPAKEGFSARGVINSWVKLSMLSGLSQLEGVVAITEIRPPTLP